MRQQRAASPQAVPEFSAEIQQILGQPGVLALALQGFMEDADIGGLSVSEFLAACKHPALLSLGAEVLTHVHLLSTDAMDDMVQSLVQATTTTTQRPSADRSVLPPLDFTKR